jgi:SAM-dependent methyltransferase
LKRLATQALRVDPIRTRVARARFIYYVKLLKRLRTFDANSDGIGENTISHNVKGMVDLTVVRSNLLIRPLSVIQCLDAESRILSIGPRTEGEIFNLMAHGFSPERIRGLDLISYSPFIDVGNMHDMPYADSSWDAVMMGWVISYSSEQRRAAMEVVRVTRPGGIVAVGLEWYPPGLREQIQDNVGYRSGHTHEPTSTDEVLELFGDHVDRVYVRHDPAENLDRVGEIFVIFSIKKPDRAPPPGS